MDTAGPATESHASGAMPTLHGVTMCDVSERECRCVLDPAASVSEGIVSAVRRSLDRDGRDSGLTDLSPLARTVDTDSMDELFAGSTCDGVAVAFHYEGYLVTVRDGERVVVTRDQDRSAP